MYQPKIFGFIAIALFAFTAVAQTPNASTVPVKNKPMQPIKLLEINSAARVSFVGDKVTIVGTNNKSRRASVGETIFVGDSLITGKQGEIHLEMEDSGYIAVRPNSRLQISTFAAKGDENDSSAITLSYGGVRFVNGWISGLKQPKNLFKTPNATIQMRGGDHEIRVVAKAAGAGNDAAGTYFKVLVGGGQIVSTNGKLEVAVDQAGFVAQVGNRPQLFKEITKVFSATENEKLIEGKFVMVQKNAAARLETRRNENKMRLQNAEKLTSGQKSAQAESAQQKR